MMHSVREELVQIRAEQRVAAALKASVLPAAKFQMKPGDSVMGYNEKERKWKQRLLVLDVNGKQVWVNYGNRIVKQNITRMFPSFVDNGGQEVILLLKSLSSFAAGEPPGILLTE